MEPCCLYLLKSLNRNYLVQFFMCSSISIYSNLWPIMSMFTCLFVFLNYFWYEKLPLFVPAAYVPKFNLYI